MLQKLSTARNNVLNVTLHVSDSFKLENSNLHISYNLSDALCYVLVVASCQIQIKTT